MNMVFCLAFLLPPLVAANESRAQQAAPNTPPGQTGPGPAAPSPSHLAAARALVVACGMSRSFSIIIPQFMDQIGSSLTQTRPELIHDLNAVLTGLKPDAFNIGINDGLAAGQTIEHAHVHIIPRWKGDKADPRGGIRWILDDKANYWSR